MAAPHRLTVNTAALSSQAVFQSSSSMRENDASLSQSKNLVWGAVARFMLVALFFDALAPLFPQIAASYDISPDQFQSIVGAAYIAFALSQLASVKVINRFGLYGTAAMSCIYLGIASVLICLFREPVVFALLFVSMFIVNSFGSNATRVALREATSDDGFRRLFAWASGAVEIKQIAMPLLAGAVAAAYGWRPALLILVTPVVLAGLFIAFASRDGSRPKSRPVVESGFSRWAAIVTMPSFLAPTLIAAAFQIAFGPLSARLPFVLGEASSLDSLTIGLVLSVASAAVALGFFVSAHLSPRISSTSMVLIGVALMIVGTATMTAGSAVGSGTTITGIVVVQSSLGFIMTACSGDALSASDRYRTSASALFGFLQPTVGGASVILAGTLPFSNAGTLIALCSISVTSILAVQLLIGPAARSVRSV